MHWMGRQAVVALPEHIDVSNASQIREELLWVINCGAIVLIADMTATLSCDQSGADAVMRAYQRALASGTQLRLAVTAQIVRRVFDAYGMSRLISVSLAGGSHRGRGRPQPRRRPSRAVVATLEQSPRPCALARGLAASTPCSTATTRHVRGPSATGMSSTTPTTMPLNPR